MENTCSGKECLLWRKFKANCPNYIESSFIPTGETQPRLIKDCAPKRTLLMLQDVYNRLEGLQKAHEGQRNETAKLVAVTIEALKSSGAIDYDRVTKRLSQAGHITPEEHGRGNTESVSEADISG